MHSSLLQDSAQSMVKTKQGKEYILLEFASSKSLFCFDSCSFVMQCENR